MWRLLICNIFCLERKRKEMRDSEKGIPNAKRTKMNVSSLPNIMIKNIGLAGKWYDWLYCLHMWRLYVKRTHTRLWFA